MPHRIDQMLSQNIGSKLTMELATGISATCRRVIEQIKAEYAAELAKIHGFSLEGNSAQNPATPVAQGTAQATEDKPNAPAARNVPNKATKKPVLAAPVAATPVTDSGGDPQPTDAQ